MSGSFPMPCMGASGVIGPQIDIPAVFAAEYAMRFFKGLLGVDNGGPEPVGILMRRLAREFIDKHNNPLGLAYSLYRGMDCLVDWGKVQ